MKKIHFTSVIFLLITFSCISTKSTLKNVDNNAPIPKLTQQNTFVITEYSKDKKYGYEPDYPINIFYKNTKNDTINIVRFLNALTGPKGETLSYKKIETCCPFPTKQSDMGAGFLDVYEVTWQNQKKPIKLYFNIYERGAILVPVGLSLKQN